MLFASHIVKYDAINVTIHISMAIYSRLGDNHNSSLNSFKAIDSIIA